MSRSSGSEQDVQPPNPINPAYQVVPATCDDFDAYVTGGLSLDRRKAFEEHRLGCWKCRRKAVKKIDLNPWPS